MDRRPSLRTIAVTLVCLLLPLTMLAGVLASAFYKTNNPDSVDITAGLAYLRQTMVASIAVFTIISAVIIGLIVAMYRSDHNFTQAKLPMVLLVAVVGMLGAILLINQYTDSVEDQYLKDSGRPTLSDFFDATEQREQEAR